jgi:hypothetical protein
MRKPISKNALRRAMDRAISDGDLECSVPVNTVVDRLWHEMEKENYGAGRKRPIPRDTLRAEAVTPPTDLE